MYACKVLYTIIFLRKKNIRKDLIHSKNTNENPTYLSEYPRFSARKILAAISFHEFTAINFLQTDVQSFK